MVTILEATVDFDCEISVVVARDKAGNVVPYDPVRNHHENHILATTVVPAVLIPAIEKKRLKRSRRLSQAPSYVMTDRRLNVFMNGWRALGEWNRT